MLPDHYDHGKIESSVSIQRAIFACRCGIRAPICLLMGKIAHLGAATMIRELRGLAFVMKMVDSNLDQSALHRAKFLCQICIAYRHLARTKSVLMSNGVDV
jgi:hypothetical protein